MRLSQMFGSTQREIPSEADTPSQQLLLRAGMIMQVAAGVYSYMPLGWRVLKKVENIIREEMDGAGGQELAMPVLQPVELWQHVSGQVPRAKESFQMISPFVSTMEPGGALHFFRSEMWLYRIDPYTVDSKRYISVGSYYAHRGITSGSDYQLQGEWAHEGPIGPQEIVAWSPPRCFGHGWFDVIAKGGRVNSIDIVWGHSTMQALRHPSRGVIPFGQASKGAQPEPARTVAPAGWEEDWREWS